MIEDASEAVAAHVEGFKAHPRLQNTARHFSYSRHGRYEQPCSLRIASALQSNSQSSIIIRRDSKMTLEDLVSQSIGMWLSSSFIDAYAPCNKPLVAGVC